MTNQSPPAQASDEPTAWMHDAVGRVDAISSAVKTLWQRVRPKHVEHYTIPLYRHAAAPCDRNAAIEEVARAIYERAGQQYQAKNYDAQDECIRIVDLIRALKAQPAPTEAQGDGLSPVYAWLERSTRNSPPEVANAARTMMAFYQGAEFPETQGEDSARLDAIPMWEYYGCTEAEWIEFKAWSKNRARAGAETGGVKS